MNNLSKNISNIIDLTEDFQARRIINEVEKLLRENNELDQYDVGIEWYAGDKNYSILLKDVNSETYTILDPEMLGINL